MRRSCSSLQLSLSGFNLLDRHTEETPPIGERGLPVSPRGSSSHEGRPLLSCLAWPVV
jgi:hypothetical protein